MTTMAKVASIAAATDIMDLQATFLLANRLHANHLLANRLHANRLRVNRLHANRLRVNRLRVNRLHANRLHANRLRVNRLHANLNVMMIGEIMDTNTATGMIMVKAMTTMAKVVSIAAATDIMDLQATFLRANHLRVNRLRANLNVMMIG
jgi:hypothetical protein